MDQISTAPASIHREPVCFVIVVHIVIKRSLIHRISLSTIYLSNPSSDFLTIQLQVEGFVHNNNSCCFAGIDDELVISVSHDLNLYIWSLPNEQTHSSQSVDHSFCVLRGHKMAVNCVRYSKADVAVVSCDNDGIIKLWTANAPQW